MGFQIIPAIDVSGGRLCRVAADGPVAVDAFGGDAVAAARAFLDAGAVWIHVVDVDLALEGSQRALDTVRAIADLGAHVQASGGIVARTEVEAALAAGAERVVLGSAALASRATTERIVSALGPALAVSIEADGPLIVPRGRGAPELSLWDTLRWLGSLPVARYVLTEVGRMGTLEGPDLDGIWALAEHTGTPVIASGGIRSPDDVVSVAALGPPVEGVIVGRALTEGLDLRELLDAAP